MGDADIFRAVLKDGRRLLRLAAPARDARSARGIAVSLQEPNRAERGGQRRCRALPFVDPGACRRRLLNGVQRGFHPPVALIEAVFNEGHRFAVTAGDELARADPLGREVAHHAGGPSFREALVADIVA